ncbi:MAG TPA: helix-hairpin-helix domain-containing protein [Pyrinomonadaceae bacterium]|jgi:competence protein ComEA|nr:helix-hairpin-helix domain-containing protein [Pyrinomonadaceae bacterium]
MSSVLPQLSSLFRRSLIVILLVLLFFSLGCVKRSYNYQATPGINAASTQSTSNIASENNQQPTRININTASAEELEKLPGIGKALAARIIEHREKFGPFRKPEHLIIVRGISEHRFREFKDLITVE